MLSRQQCQVSLRIHRPIQRAARFPRQDEDARPPLPLSRLYEYRTSTHGSMEMTSKPRGAPNKDCDESTVTCTSSIEIRSPQWLLPRAARRARTCCLLMLRAIRRGVIPQNIVVRFIELAGLQCLRLRIILVLAVALAFALAESTMPPSLGRAIDVRLHAAEKCVDQQKQQRGAERKQDAGPER